MDRRVRLLIQGKTGVGRANLLLPLGKIAAARTIARRPGT
jgi:hypothetical protein